MKDMDESPEPTHEQRIATALSEYITRARGEGLSTHDVDVLTAAMFALESRAVVGPRGRVAGSQDPNASRDEVTGLLDRKGLYGAIPERGFSADRIAVTLIDLDQFKPVNDIYGHAAGDEVLAEVGRRLSALVRGDDLVARWGGDEFAVVSQRPSSLDERVFAARLSDAIEAPIQLSTGQSVRVGASIGTEIVEHALSGTDLDTVMERADALMYTEKRRRHVGEHAFVDLAKDPAVADDIAWLQAYFGAHGGSVPEHQGSALHVADAIERVTAYVQTTDVALTPAQLIGHLRGQPISADRRAAPSFDR